MHTLVVRTAPAAGGPVGRLGVGLLFLTLLLTPPAGAQVVRSGAGATAAAAIAARDLFRLDLGGGTVAGPGGLFGGVRREINWDGAPDGVSAPNAMPANAFQSRGNLYSTPGASLQLSADNSNPTSTPPDYANIDPSYGRVFEAFSLQRLFTPIGSNVLDVHFVLPGTSTPGGTRGFGAIFSDVDLGGTTSLEFFGLNGASLGTFFAPGVVGNETFSFLGVSFAGAIVSRVRITTGNAALAAGVLDDDGATTDLVVMDDFLFGEVQATPEPATTALLAAGLIALGVVVCRRKLAA